MKDQDSSRPLRLAMPRRRLFRASAIAAAGGAAAGAPLRALAAGVAPEHLDSWLALFQEATPATPETYTPVALTPRQLATLTAAVERIIPEDDLGPGAARAGVQIYIDRSLKGPNAALLSFYQQGLAALDTAAGSGGFTAVAAGKQDAILKSAEAGKLTGAPEGFFATLLAHTRQGMFGDPIYGGNIDFAGWDLIGYPGIKLSWTAEEQELDAVVKPEHISVAKYGGKSW